MAKKEDKRIGLDIKDSSFNPIKCPFCSNGYLRIFCIDNYMEEYKIVCDNCQTLFI